MVLPLEKEMGGKKRVDLIQLKVYIFIYLYIYTCVIIFDLFVFDIAYFILVTHSLFPPFL